MCYCALEVMTTSHLRFRGYRFVLKVPKALQKEKKIKQRILLKMLGTALESLAIIVHVIE